MEAHSDLASDAGSLRILPVGEIAGDFFVPAYQRGYRWTRDEVTQLLGDVRDSGGATYYLQPLVVKGRTDGSWELVDGQQRLTTLYLIFRYLSRTHLPSVSTEYSITYETREGSKGYLETLSEADADSNIDFFHMFNANQCIEEWFSSFGQGAAHEAMRLYGYLFEHVKVLWYEAPDAANPNELFTRLNVGRIPLTDAELVKALLLSQGRSNDGGTDRALEMATHWDAIERELRVPEVWAFVTGEAEAEATHISLLLDTLAGGPRGRERPAFQTFESLRERITNDPSKFWRAVVELHSLVLGWFEDRGLFHKVGYLIAIGRTFGELFELSKDKGRSAFDAALDEEIRAHLDLTRDEVAELTYSNRKNKTSDVLLLMNAEKVRATKDSAERYSFRAQAAGSWSLEHIHAQNANPLVTTEQRRSWLEYHRNALTSLSEADLGGHDRSNLLDRIDEVLAGEITREAFEVLESELSALFTPPGEADSVEGDSIANLALLDHRDNAALSNSVFEVKRRDVIRRDKAGSYIPVCTRNVFLKYYTEEGSQQVHFWSATDRQQYLANIQDAVGPYMRPEADEDE